MVFFRSLGSRLNLTVISVNALILIGIIIIAINSSNSALYHQALERFQQKHDNAADRLQTQLLVTYDALLRLSDSMNAVELDDSLALRRHLTNFVEEQPDLHINQLQLIRPDESAAVLRLPEISLTDLNEWRIYRQARDIPTDDPALQSVRETGTPVWFMQEVAYFGYSDMPVMSLAVPYHDTDGDVIGVLWADMLVDDLREMVTETLNAVGLLAETEAGYSLLLNADNRLITAHNFNMDQEIDSLQAQLDLLTTTVEEDEASDSIPHQIEDPISGQSSLASRAIFPISGWQLMSVLPGDEIPVVPASIMVPTGMIAIFGLILLSWMLNRVVAREILVPLKHLGNAAQELGSGDLRYYIGHQSRQDEIGRLAQAMDSMKSNLAHSYGELSRWSRTLEKRVRERTEELDIARQEAQANATEMRAVYDESLMVVRESRLRPVLHAFASRILTLLEATYCSVWLLNEERDRLQQVATHDTATLQTIIIDASEGLVGQAVSRAEAIMIDDYTTYEHRLTEEEVNRGMTFVRAICVPLIFVGKPIGAVVAGRAGDAPPFDDDDRRLMTLFANMVSPSVRNAQLFVAMNDARNQAETANQVKTRFLASVTHELRTPLNLIINNMDFMRIGAFGEVTPEQVTRLNQTTRSAEHLLYLINDLLDVSKIEAGEMQLFIQTNDVSTLLEDAIDNARAYLETFEGKQEKLTFEADIEPDLPQIPMDSRRIRQVLTNLLTNAIKFTDEGRVTLTVKRAEFGVEFSVADTGMGIPDDEMKVLFAAFERTSNVRARNIEGTGLGLPISQYMVQQHGGRIKVTSTVNEGSTFSFVLPYETPAEMRKKDARTTDTQILAVLSSPTQ